MASKKKKNRKKEISEASRLVLLQLLFGTEQVGDLLDDTASPPSSAELAEAASQGSWGQSVQVVPKQWAR